MSSRATTTPSLLEPDLCVTDVEHSFGAVRALNGASLEVARGEIVSILGPSGCGKSTLLQLIAGHLSPAAGRIEVAGRCVVDASSGIAAIPPRQRGVGMVFQDYALFPHLTVAENVAFGMQDASSTRRRAPLLPAARRAAKHARRRVVDELLATFGIDGLGERYPGELSGGQQQRVAIARALAQEPTLLLLDEPFGNLDAAMRERVRSEIVARLRATGVTCVFVTHDQEEALAISDRVAVMQAGRVMQVDEPEALYRRPFCVEVAEFLGRTNILHGVVRNEMVATELGEFAVPGTPDGEARLLIRPELIDVRVDADGPAIVSSREFRGHDALYTLVLASGERVWAHRPSVEMAGVGERVSLTLLPGEITALPLDAADATRQSPAGGSSSSDMVGRIVSNQSGTALTATSTSAGNAASV